MLCHVMLIDNKRKTKVHNNRHIVDKMETDRQRQYERSSVINMPSMQISRTIDTIKLFV